MPLPTRSSRALAMVSFPVVLTLGILTIPVVVDYRDHDLAARAASHSVRWFWGHMFTGAAFGLATVAACAMAGCLLRTRHARWVYVGMPMMAVGAALHAVGLGADGIAPLAVIAGGGRAQTFFDGSGGLVSGVFLAGAVAFGVGLMVQLQGLFRIGIPSSRLQPMVFLSAIAFMGFEAVPSGWGLYGVAGASWVVFGTVAASMWRWHGSPQHGVDPERGGLQ